MSTSHVRTFVAEIERVDWSTLAGQFVPYGTAAMVTDITPVGVERYREGFDHGAFTHQAQSALVTAISFRDQHEGGWGKMGYVTQLREESSALIGEVKIAKDWRETVAMMLEDGINGLSVGFRAFKTRTSPEGIRWRTRAHLDHVALVTRGAYADAQVTGLRSAEDPAAEVQAAVAAELAEEEAARIRARADIDSFLAAEEERSRLLRERLGL